MPKITVEWDSGRQTWDLDDQEYEEFLESGDEPDMYFDAYVSDVYVEKYVEIIN